jgi:hypothetical protein
MEIFSQRRQLDDRDRMTLVVYLLFQDRVEEALAVFEAVDREKLASGLQYDYLQAYLAFYREDLETARAVAARYEDYPVDRWRERFVEVLDQLGEIEGGDRLVEERSETREAGQAKEDPSFAFTIQDRKIDLRYRHLEEVQVNFYRMDLEFLFSTNPFMNSDSARFRMIKPNRSDRYALAAEQESLAIALPSEFEGENVLVEIVGGGVRKATAHYSHRLNVQVAAQRGELRVTDRDENRPLSRVYVKVYADIGGEPKFYKDGYTDLRGRFDYLSLNTGELDQASRFGILVMSEGHGALVQEAGRPQQ